MLDCVCCSVQRLPCIVHALMILDAALSSNPDALPDPVSPHLSLAYNAGRVGNRLFIVTAVLALVAAAMEMLCMKRESVALYGVLERSDATQEYRSQP